MDLFGIIVTVMLALLVLAAWLIPQYQRRQESKKTEE